MSVEAISWVLNLARPSRPRRAAVHRVQVRPRRPGQPGRPGRHRRVPVGGHAGPLHRAVRAHSVHLPGPAASPRRHLALQSRASSRRDQARRPAATRRGPEPRHDPRAPLPRPASQRRSTSSPALPPGSRPPHRRALMRGGAGVQPAHPAPGNGGPVDKVPGEVQQVHVAGHVAPDKAFVLSPACICATCSLRLRDDPGWHIPRDQRQLPAGGARTGTDAAGRRVRLRCGPWPFRATLFRSC